MTQSVVQLYSDVKYEDLLQITAYCHNRGVYFRFCGKKVEKCLRQKHKEEPVISRTEEQEQRFRRFSNAITVLECSAFYPIFNHDSTIYPDEIDSYEYFNGAALYAVFDAQNVFSRCGTSKNMKKTLKSIQLWPNERYFVIYEHIYYKPKEKCDAFDKSPGKVKKCIKQIMANKGYWADRLKWWRDVDNPETRLLPQ